MSLVETPRSPTTSSPAAKTEKESVVTPHKTMRGHTDLVWGVAHLPGEQRMITCSYDSSLRLWDLESGTQIGDEWRDDADEVDEAGVRTMALSPNGKTLASGSEDGTVRLWDIETGKVGVKWKAHSQFVKSVCWNPDGERIVSGGWGGTARVWNLRSGEPIQDLDTIKTGHESVFVVSYSPKATMIATGGHNESAIKIWDAKTGELLSTIGDDDVWSLAWTSDEKKLISGTVDGSIRIFDTATKQQIAVLEGHDEVVAAIALFPNDRLLASTSRDNTARLWNLDTNFQVGPPIQHENDVNCAAFSVDGKLLATTCDDGNAYLWDIQSILNAAGLEDLLSMPDVQQSELKKKASATRCPAPHRLPGFFNDVQERDLPPSITRRLHHNPSVHSRRSAFAPSWGSRPRALLARIPPLFHRSKPNTDEPVEFQQHPGPTTSSRRSPPVVEVAAQDDKKALYVAPRKTAGKTAGDKAKGIKNPKWWFGRTQDALFGHLFSLFRSALDTDDAIELQQWARQTTSSRCSHHVVEVAAIRDKQAIYVARQPETASEMARRIKNPTLWPAVIPYRTMQGHTGFVEGVVHLPGGQHIITCSYNGSPKLWDLESGAQIGDDWRDEGGSVGLKTIALSPKGDTIASGSIDGTVRLWDVEMRKVVRKWTGHAGAVKSVCWSPDGERVVSGASDETVKVWNVKSATPVLGLKTTKTGQSVHTVSYSPKATKIATAGFNIKIWDAKSGKLLSTVGHAANQVVCSLVWTSDEKKLISGYSGGSIRIFDTATWWQIALLDGHQGAVYSITLSRNDRLLVSTSGDQKARLWNLDTKFLVGPPLQHEHIVTSAAFSADGELLSTGCADENAYVWNIHAILKATGLEHLLPIPDAPKLKLEQKVHASSHASGSSQDIEAMSFLEANATRCSDLLREVDELPPGFFDTEADIRFSATPGAHYNLSALLDRLSSLLRRSRPNEAIETRQPPVSSESRSHAFLSRLSSFLRSPPNTDEISELPQPLTLARLNPQVLLDHLSLLLPHSRLHTNSAIEPQQSLIPSGSRPGALIGRLSSLLRFSPNTDEATEFRQWPRHTTSSRCGPRVVEVVAQRDKQALYVSPPRETASDKAKRIKNPQPWVRVVLFLCCVSPGTDDTRGGT
ncbi:WD40-repeat-containing domain protein [Suillus lakei]|nr:WD40-repeat-containing domain protein [Suillus lakei]